MKLLRYGPLGQEKPGILDDDGRIRDLSAHVPDIGVETISDQALGKLRKLKVADLPVVDGSPRLGVPVSGIRQLVAIGLNYRGHAAEAKMAVPTEPVVFYKAITSLAGANDDVVMPPGSQAMDWELELAVVIGKTARNVPVTNAAEYVAGYAIANDVSERDWQLNRGGTWCKGKSFDTFCPLGPWLVTRDEIANPQELAMKLTVGEQKFQDSSTADMIFPVTELIAYCSRFMTLLAGDVIITGTPQGVGWAQNPKRFLRAGEIIHSTISGLGHQKQTVVPASNPGAR